MFIKNSRALDINGIYSHKTKTFYYLESGNMRPFNAVDRLKTRLLQREFIEMMDPKLTEVTYEYITLAEAKKQDYLIEPIYISPVIKKLVESEDKPVANPWK